ncbi:MAG TPA: hypothetical protein VIW01_10715 [Dehalococcoidia bacterium]
MSFTEFFLIVLAVNLVSAVFCGFIASRNGRDPFAWQLFGAVLGPVALVILAGALNRKSG